jgi:hypothetical protein
MPENLPPEISTQVASNTRMLLRQGCRIVRRQGVGDDPVEEPQGDARKPAAAVLPISLNHTHGAPIA